VHQRLIYHLISVVEEVRRKPAPAFLIVGLCGACTAGVAIGTRSAIEETPPAPVRSTITPTETVIGTEVSANVPSGRLYAWLYGVLNDCQYGFIDPVASDSPSLHPLFPQDADVPGPCEAVALGFSRFSDRVAYIIVAGHAELWMGDVGLKDVKRVWTDSEDLLASVALPEAGNILRVEWTASDNAILLTGELVDGSLVLYSLPAATARGGHGSCDRLTWGQPGMGFEIWCRMERPDGLAYVGVDSTGSLRASTAPPEGSNVVRDWALSKEGDAALYATGNLRVVLEAPEANVTELPVTYSPLIGYPHRRGLQWSANGERVLVYGSPDVRSYCPPFADLAFGDLVERPCWIVFDALSGDLVWWPRDSVAEMLSTRWQQLVGDHDATISPDGEWLFLSLLDPPFRYGVVASISGEESFQIHSGDIDLVSWAGK